MMNIHIDERININGAQQFIAIRAEREGLPLLLYLHGGPGDAALPLVLKYNYELQKYFTLVIWEQRGAGKSYYEFDKQEVININTYVQDTYMLVEYLLEKYNQKNVFLIGHSWGSVIGLMFCKQYPALVRTYIGCGQVVNMKKSCQSAYDFAISQTTGKSAHKLSRIDCTYTGEQWFHDLLYVTKLVVKHKGSLYGASNYNKLILDVILSGEYSIRELINRQKGAAQGIQCLWQELMQVSFEDTMEFAMPVIFVEGKYDTHVSSELAREYYETITSEKKFYLFEKSCHFPQWSEAERFHRILSSLD